MAIFQKVKEGFRFLFGGAKLNAPPDAIGATKYASALNVRMYQDSAVRTRPGLAQLFVTDGTPQNDIRAYSRLNTDNKPRLLSVGANNKVWLDNGAQVGTLAGGSSLGAELIPFRPNQSPTPYMYIANGEDYQKFSAPDNANAVVASQAGIAEPPAPPDSVVTNQYESLIGVPSGGTFAPGGNAGAVTVANRITDSVQDVFDDPANSALTTLQVTAQSNVAGGVYLASTVQAYFWLFASDLHGGFDLTYPLDTGTADAAGQNNSLLFNPPQVTGSEDPNQHPMKWATINGSGVITGYTMPYAGDSNPAVRYNMAVLAQLYVPVAGTYTLHINHNDGMMFAIAGASLTSGPLDNPYGQTRTAVGGYKFTNGTVGGTQRAGYRKESFVVHFPIAGVYALEIDFGQWTDQQCCNMYWFTGGVETVIVNTTANQNYQRGMVIKTVHAGASHMHVVQDVFPPLPSALGISAIRYGTGLTAGHCWVVPASLSPGPGTEGVPVGTAAYLSGLRRGSLIQIGTEVCLVESSTAGPDGTICFETATANAHTAADLLYGVPAISILTTSVGGTAFPGDPITSPDIEYAVTTGVGTVTMPLATNPFVSASLAFQTEDYLHLSINVDSLANLNEIKLLFDCGDGTFTQNFYYYAIRPSDVAAGVSNLLTQLGVAQLVTQRATIDEENAAAAANQGMTYSSAQTVPGDRQWSEIKFQISQLTRVGNDQTRSLQNVSAVQVLINCSGTVNIQQNSITVTGGYGADVGAAGAPYLYRIRPRSRVTGAKGNPSPATRWGVNPRRQRVYLALPDADYDDQIDIWDIYRYGGTITSWRFIGTAPVGGAGTVFFDIYGDDVAAAGDALEFDNMEPWPTVDVPLSATVSVVGTTGIVAIAGPTNILRYLPGNFIQINQATTYTLWTRPTQISAGQYLLQFVENAGVVTGAMSIYEPIMARQFLPYMWGPDTDGTIFACGDPLRPGTLYFAKSNQPDSAPDRYNVEITPPSEPLMGGENLSGTPFVASTEKWWRLYFQPHNAYTLPGRSGRYSFIQQPIPRGLAAPYGHCTDGAAIYFWAKDGIWSSAEGSLTDTDLYNLFPHEGVAGQQVTYGAVTYYPPDYSRAGTFRLAHVNGYLYAPYQDSGGIRRVLVYNLRTKSWSQDSYATQVSTVYHPEQQEGTVLTNSELYSMLVFGTVNGKVAKQQDLTNDLGSPIPCVIATWEFNGGDIRSSDQWGDIYLDVAPVSGMIATPMAFSLSAAPVTVLPPSARDQFTVSVGGALLSNFLGVQLTWTDDFSTQSQPTTLYVWQPSFLDKPETIADRSSDWYSLGGDDTIGEPRWWQGFTLHADTFNVVKQLRIRDAETLTLHPFTPTVRHNGECSITYSFNTPFIAYHCRVESADQVEWRFFGVEWHGEATPMQGETWQTQGTSFGLNGYSHIQRLSGAYAASTDVTITITSFDGQSPAPITLPATGGAYHKLLRVLTANKGQLYFFRATSSSPFQLYLEDFEVMVGGWGRTGGYLTYKSLGGHRGDAAKV